MEAPKAFLISAATPDKAENSRRPRVTSSFTDADASSGRFILFVSECKLHMLVQYLVRLGRCRYSGSVAERCIAHDIFARTIQHPPDQSSPSRSPRPSALTSAVSTPSIEEAASPAAGAPIGTSGAGGECHETLTAGDIEGIVAPLLIA